MDALGFVPEAVELPTDLGFRQRRVATAIDLLGLVGTEEALDVRLVIPGVLRTDRLSWRVLLHEQHGACGVYAIGVRDTRWLSRQAEIWQIDDPVRSARR